MVSGTRVVIVNCVISNKMEIKINKTIQTLEDRCKHSLRNIYT